jgi:hypothetical protein
VPLFGAVEASAVALFGRPADEVASSGRGRREWFSGSGDGHRGRAVFGAMHADMRGSVGIVRVVSTTCLRLACGMARLGERDGARRDDRALRLQRRVADARSRAFPATRTRSCRSCQIRLLALAALGAWWRSASAWPAALPAVEHESSVRRGVLQRHSPPGTSGVVEPDELGSALHRIAAGAR